MKIEPFKAFLPDTSRISDNDLFFSSVSDRFIEFDKKNYFIPQHEEALFAYKISSPTGSYLGLIAANAISDITEQHILPHEKTIESKEIHLQNLLNIRQAQIKPVLCTFKCPKSLNNYLSQICESAAPILSIPFEGTNELHQLWSISDPSDIDYLVGAFKKAVEHVYIADGHHRCSAVLQLYNKKEELESYPNNLLVILLPIRDLKIFEYNRVIDFEHTYSKSDLLKVLESIFKINTMKQRASRPKSRAIHMLLDDVWYRMEWKKEIVERETSEEFKVDTYLFNKYVIQKIFRIEDLRRDNRITYVPGIYGMPGIKLMVGNDTGKAGFMLPKIKKSEFMSVSNRSFTMPPKSTWFEPRIKNGIVVLPFAKR